MLIRLFILILILPLLAIVIISPSTIHAQCTGTGKINIDNGLLTSVRTTNFAPTPGANVNCVTGQPASIPQFSFKSYAEMKTLYYDQAKSTILKNPIINGNATNIDTTNPLSQITGNLIINSDNTSGKTGVVFVGGNLYINTNLTNTIATAGIVFVVKGTIYISRDVDKVNAFLITHGKDPSYIDTMGAGHNITPFCDAWNGTACDATTDNSAFASQKYLTINGSVISLNATIAPQFLRQKATETTPSEIINYDSKYLVIMKDIFSRDLKIWREVQ